MAEFDSSDTTAYQYAIVSIELFDAEEYRSLEM